MQLKLTLERGGDRETADLLVTADTTATVGDLARALSDRDRAEAPRPQNPTLRIEDGHRVLDPSAGLVDAGVVSGQHVAIVEASAWSPATDANAAGTLVVERGPDEGRSFPLRAGSNQLGRGVGNDVALSDGQVSKAHLRINVGEVIEVVDLGSSNGTFVGEELVQRAVVRPDDRLLVGETVVRLVHHHDGGVRSAAGLLYNRSPRIDIVYAGVEIPAPEPPDQFRRQRVPVIPMIAPVIFGCLMFAITQQLVTVLFVALSPIMLVGNVLESRVFGRREHERACKEFREALGVLDADLTEAAGHEASRRRREHPDTRTIAGAARVRDPLLWSYRADARGFLEVRLGIGAMPSRNWVDARPKQGAVPELVSELREVIQSHATVDAVPVVASLSQCGSLGITGPRAAALPVARAAVAQIVSLHSPAEVVLGAVATAEKASDWAALKWLPHTTSDHSPIGRDEPHLAASPGGVQHLVSALEELVARRLGDGSDATRDQPEHLPAVVLLVEDDAPIERSRLVELAERGRSCGVHLLWIATSVPALPAACRTYLDVAAGGSRAGFVDGDGTGPGGSLVEDVDAEQLDVSEFRDLARTLCPVVDAGARVDDASDLPRSVTLPALTGMELIHDPDAILDRWRVSGSLPSEMRRRRPNHLRGVVGSASGGSMVLDLREHGPHALVGGTTGAGKSEFLQSWIMGMAVEHSPAQVTFLLVDYKGGAAFADCVRLPHCVGLVTDLGPQLVQRALTSLHAELQHREALLHRKRKKDLLELEKDGDPDAPPSLVIVVDEFAALAQEVPEFVDGVINVAQRGRSLGLHLVLATQRPAGVITGNLRANTNLRIALRVADEGDSEDVVGSKIAATFDPAVPGRAIAKTGPGRLVPFQSSYVGGHTSDEPPEPSITVQELVFGTGGLWEVGDVDGNAATQDVRASDLQRLVASVNRAFEEANLDRPRRPWLDELAPVYDLSNLPSPSRTDAMLTYGILDDPAQQRQHPVWFEPDIHGNMAVIGTGGAGKSTVLRTLGIVAGLGFRGGPCHVYGLDFGARGLAMLEALPHVGTIVTGDDGERVRRLLGMLRATIDERAARYSAERAGTIAEYRQRAQAPDEPRVLLLLDNIGAFRSAYEVGPQAKLFDQLLSIAADGRPVGVHVVVTADRPGAMPSALTSVVQQQLVLRLTADNDLAALGIPADWFGANTPPGRGYVQGNHVQVMVLGGSPNTSRQAEAIESLAAELRTRPDRAPAPEIGRLPEQVSLGSLPVTLRKAPVIGVDGDTLEPATIVPEDVFLIAGPPQSGRTTVMATIAGAIERSRPGEDLVYLGAGRSPVVGLVRWSEDIIGVDAIADLAPKVAERVRSGWKPAAIVLEDHASLLNSSAEQPALDLVAACRAAGVLLVTDGETSAIGSWPLQMAVKAGRHGILLQPDQHEGDQIFKTPLPRGQRSDFPSGRGFYIRSGRAQLVQVALPEWSEG